MNAVPELISVGMLIKATDAGVSSVRTAAKRMAGAKATLKRLTPNLLWYSLNAPAVKGLTPAKAFEFAHRLLEIDAVLAAEPAFESKVPFPIEPPPEVVVRSRAAAAATPDYVWHIKQVKAAEARTRFGVDGSSIRVAHPDTGYTLHPELIIGTNVRADLGYNFQENKPSPIEPLKTIKHGHGTATASVLIGIPGKQHSFPNDDSFAEGVAPGAELVPMRVDKNVWWFGSAANDVKAIDRAMTIDCGVISMSRSGTDQGPLHDAVLLATRKGIIIVAAAGNCNFGCKIRSPANYPQVVCAAGSTVEMKPWKDSSHGKAATIGAPAESVYRARAFKKNNNYAYNVETSSGTSYATPIVAGAAALWLELHGGTQAIAQKVGALDRVPIVFKHLLTTAGFQAGVNWDPKKYGRGILDCVKLLSAPLPPPDKIAAIELSIRSAREVSGNAGARAFIDRSTPPSTDGRAAALFALELETAELQRPLATMLVDEEGIEAWLKRDAEGLLKSMSLSRQLRKALSI